MVNPETAHRERSSFDFSKSSECWAWCFRNPWLFSQEESCLSNNFWGFSGQRPGISDILFPMQPLTDPWRESFLKFIADVPITSLRAMHTALPYIILLRCLFTCLEPSIWGSTAVVSAGSPWQPAAGGTSWRLLRRQQGKMVMEQLSISPWPPSTVAEILDVPPLTHRRSFQEGSVYNLNVSGTVPISGYGDRLMLITTCRTPRAVAKVRAQFLPAKQSSLEPK